MMVKNHLEVSINQDDIKFIEKIDLGVFKSSARKLKPGKTDPVLKITSDFIVHAPDIVFQLLSMCLKSYMMHTSQIFFSRRCSFQSSKTSLVT